MRRLAHTECEGAEGMQRMAGVRKRAGPTRAVAENIAVSIDTFSKVLADGYEFNTQAGLRTEVI